MRDCPPSRLVSFSGNNNNGNENNNEDHNPAARLIDFLDENFVRMSCGGLFLDTRKCREHSRTMAEEVGVVSDDVARKFVQSWRDMKFLA